ncbi:MAG: hypothetical protein E6Q97_15695 [Desulfurellales bacterium]|nr:MAG: hypothetical protein E6Q97_15695 [Desulfurellales bacterium]
MATFIRNDGGRAAAGFKGTAGDCVTRAIAIASGLPYAYVYEAMAAGNEGQRTTKRSGKSSGKRTANSGIYTTRKWFKDWMVAHGFRWVPTMTIGSGCKVHLKADELPAGKLVAMVSRHAVAVIDGAIHDTYDPSRGGTRCVYGYWVKEAA